MNNLKLDLGPGLKPRIITEDDPSRAACLASYAAQLGFPAFLRLRVGEPTEELRFYLPEWQEQQWPYRLQCRRCGEFTVFPRKRTEGAVCRECYEESVRKSVPPSAPAAAADR